MLLFAFYYQLLLLLLGQLITFYYSHSEILQVSWIHLLVRCNKCFLTCTFRTSVFEDFHILRSAKKSNFTTNFFEISGTRSRFVKIYKGRRTLGVDFLKHFTFWQVLFDIFLHKHYRYMQSYTNRWTSSVLFHNWLKIWKSSKQTLDTQRLINLT